MFVMDNTRNINIDMTPRFRKGLKEASELSCLPVKFERQIGQ